MIPRSRHKLTVAFLLLITVILTIISTWHLTLMVESIVFLTDKPVANNVLKIQDRLLAGDQVPLPEILPRSNSFYFVETSGKSELTPVELCALESTANHHPDQSVNFVLTANTLQWTQLLANLIKSYKNISLKHINVESFLRDSPLEALWSEGEIQSSRYRVSHLSDVLRFLLLSRFGGNYLDSDQIVLRPFPPEDQVPNFIGKESVWIASGVMRFQRGHPVLDEFLRDLGRSFNGRDWSSNGPSLVSRVLQRICKSADLNHLTAEKCLGIRVFDPPAFYPVHWTNWTRIFDPDSAEEVVPSLTAKGSYALHVWGQESRNTKGTSKRSERKMNAFEVLAERHCPLVFYSKLSK